jgi:hypothetical protein
LMKGRVQKGRPNLDLIFWKLWIAERNKCPVSEPAGLFLAPANPEYRAVVRIDDYRVKSATRSYAAACSAVRLCDLSGALEFRVGAHREFWMPSFFFY